MKTLRTCAATCLMLSLQLAAGPTAPQEPTNDDLCERIVLEPECQMEILDLCKGLDDVRYANADEIGRLRDKIQQAENKLAADKVEGAEMKIGNVGEKIQSLLDGGPSKKGPKVFDNNITVQGLLNLASTAETCLSTF